MSQEELAARIGISRQAVSKLERADEKDKDIGSMWVRFPYPVFITMLYLFLGFALGIWRGTWILFVTIPLYYWADMGIKRWFRRRKRKKDIEVD